MIEARVLNTVNDWLDALASAGKLTESCQPPAITVGDIHALTEELQVCLESQIVRRWMLQMTAADKAAFRAVQDADIQTLFERLQPAPAAASH